MGNSKEPIVGENAWFRDSKEDKWVYCELLGFYTYEGYKYHTNHGGFKLCSVTNPNSTTKKDIPPVLDLDLTKNQIVDPAVKAWFKDKYDTEYIEGLLTGIDHRRNYPYENGAVEHKYECCVLVDPNPTVVKIPPILDLNVDQIVDPPVPAWFRYSNGTVWVKDELYAIDSRSDFRFVSNQYKYTQCILENPGNE